LHDDDERRQRDRGEDDGGLRADKPGGEKHRHAYDRDVGARHRRQVRQSCPAEVATGVGTHRRGVAEHQRGQHRGRLGGQRVAHGGGEAAPHLVSGTLHRAGGAHGRAAGRSEHRNRQVVAGRTTDARREPHRLAHHQGARLGAELGPPREDDHPAGDGVVADAPQVGAEHQSALISRAQRHRRLGGDDRHRGRLSECRGDRVAVDRVGAQGDRKPEARTHDTDRHTRDHHAEPPAAPGPARRVAGQRAGTGGQPDAAQRQYPADRPPDPGGGHRPAGQSGRYQTHVDGRRRFFAC
jgi:hypothetical protein